MAAVSSSFDPPIFKLLQGRSAETSGGLLVVLPRNQASAYCKELEKLTGWPAWLVGVVEAASTPQQRGTARIEFNGSTPRIIEVDIPVDIKNE